MDAMIRATLIYIAMFIGTLALILLVLSAFGTDSMSFPSGDKLRAGFAGFRGGNAYFAWQSFLDGSVDLPHTMDLSKWGQVGVSVAGGGATSSGRPTIELDSRIAGVGWTSEPIVARLGISDQSTGLGPATQPRFVLGVFRANYSR
jgi:hypothetical protein